MRNRSMAAALVLALGLGVGPARAGGEMRIDGFVAVPMWEEGCHRFVAAILQTSIRRADLLGYPLAVDPATWGATFRLTPTHPAADLDVTFMTRGRATTFARRALGGETGVIPEGAERALVCLYLGAPTTFRFEVARDGFEGVAVYPSVIESCTGNVATYLETRYGAAGVMGTDLPVRARDRGRRFTLTPAHGAADLDIAFRVSGGSWRRFETRAFGGERGRVPADASGARVCLYAGAPTPFDYTVGRKG